MYALINLFKKPSWKMSISFVKIINPKMMFEISMTVGEQFIDTD